MKKPKKKKRPKKRGRSSVTGEFVTGRYAKRHPRTTQEEAR